MVRILNSPRAEDTPQSPVARRAVPFTPFISAAADVGDKSFLEEWECQNKSLVGTLGAAVAGALRLTVLALGATAAAAPPRVGAWKCDRQVNCWLHATL